MKALRPRSSLDRALGFEMTEEVMSLPQYMRACPCMSVFTLVFEEYRVLVQLGQFQNGKRKQPSD
jgi:hypothetical protein